jgi:hypothetical protein
MKGRKTRSRRKPARRTKPAQGTNPAKESEPAKGTPPQIRLPDGKQLEELAKRVDRGQLLPGDYQTLRVVYDFYVQLPELLRQEGMTVQRLRELMWGAPAEPTEAVTDERPNLQTPGKDDTSSGVDV